MFPGLQPKVELSCLLQKNLRESFTVFIQSMASESFKYADQSVDAPYTLLHTDNTQLSPQSIWPISRPPWSKDILVNSIINEILFIAFQPKFFTRSLRLSLNLVLKNKPWLLTLRCYCNSYLPKIDLDLPNQNKKNNKHFLHCIVVYFLLWKRFLDDNSLWSFVILYLLLHIHFFRKIGKNLEDISRTKSGHEMRKEKCSVHQVDLGQVIVILTCKKWQIQQMILRISFTENKKTERLRAFGDFKVCYGPLFSMINNYSLGWRWMRVDICHCFHRHRSE